MKSPAKRKPSERTLFERWYCDAFGLTRSELREQRSEFGYFSDQCDISWMAWQARAELGKSESL